MQITQACSWLEELQLSSGKTLPTLPYYSYILAVHFYCHFWHVSLTASTQKNHRSTSVCEKMCLRLINRCGSNSLKGVGTGHYFVCRIQVYTLGIQILILLDTLVHLFRPANRQGETDRDTSATSLNAGPITAVTVMCKEFAQHKPDNSPNPVDIRFSAVGASIEKYANHHIWHMCFSNLFISV